MARPQCDALLVMACFQVFLSQTQVMDGSLSNVVSYDVEYSEELWHVAVLLEPATSKWLLMRGPVLSFFWGCCHAMKFPKDSPSPQVGHQNVPNNTSLTSHMVCPKFNSHVYKCKMWVKGSTHFAIGCPKRCFYLGVPSKDIGDGPINMAPFWKNEVWAHTHELINMNHKQVHLLFARVNNSSQKWWQIVLRIEFVCSQWKGWTCTLHDISFFTQGWGFFLPFYNSAPLPRGVWIFSFNKSALLTHATHARVNWCLILI
jgi:hypothetical protein